MDSYGQAVHSSAMDPSLSAAEQKQIHDSNFYSSSGPTIPDDFAELLETYSGIPRGSDQASHIQTLRDVAYQTHHYPCLGMYRFTILALSNHPLYQTHILPLLKSASSSLTFSSPQPPVFLDFGTCLGQDLRKLIHDGAPPSLLYGSDILPAFIQMGYSLFNDEATFDSSHFLTPADAFDESPSNVLNALDGKCAVVHLQAIFHLFNYKDQVALAKRVVRLLQPRPGSLVLGQNNGNVTPGEYPGRPGNRSETRFLHDEESWRALWEEVGKAMDVRFKTTSELFPHTRPSPAGIKKPEYSNRGFGWMTWEVWRE